MKSSETIAKFAEAFALAQSKIGKAYKSSSNPFFRSKYVPLDGVIETVEGPLTEHGISFLQSPGRDEFGMYLETRLLHKSGEWISGTTPIFCSKPNDTQAMGSAITYGKRYGLQAMCGMASTEDDDGQASCAKTRLDIFYFVKKLIEQKRKTKAQIDAMIKFVGESPEEKSLEDLSREQLLKLKDALQR